MNPRTAVTTVAILLVVISFLMLLGIASAGSLFAGIKSISGNPGIVPVLAVGVIYLFCALALLLPPGSRHFQK